MAWRFWGCCPRHHPGLAGRHVACVPHVPFCLHEDLAADGTPALLWVQSLAWSTCKDPTSKQDPTGGSWVDTNLWGTQSNPPQGGRSQGPCKDRAPVQGLSRGGTQSLEGRGQTSQMAQMGVGGLDQGAVVRSGQIWGLLMEWELAMAVSPRRLGSQDHKGPRTCVLQVGGAARSLTPEQTPRGDRSLGRTPQPGHPELSPPLSQTLLVTPAVLLPSRCQAVGKNVWPARGSRQ